MKTLGPLCVLLATILASGRPAARQESSPVLVRPGADLGRLIAGAPSGFHLDFSGVAYFHDRLYVSSNLGLLEVDGDRVVAIHVTTSPWTVASGPWVDVAADQMWILDANANGLLRFDGRIWTRVPMPRPDRGYYSRGDVLTGPQLLGSAAAFWLTAAGSVWRWDASNRAWTVEPHPESARTMGAIDELIGAIPVGSQLMFIMRHEAFPYLIQADETFKSDTIVTRRDGVWQTLPVDTPAPFFVEDWTTADGAGYVCTAKGELLRVTSNGVARVEAAGPCETISQSRSGHLLSSLKRLGLYELDGTWQVRASHPVASGAGDYWVHLAGDARGIAVAITAKPVADRQRTSAGNLQFTTNAPTGLWVSRGASLVQVRMQ